jgi:Fibronectin type III domain
MLVVLSRLLLLGVALVFGQLPLQAALFLIDAPANLNAPPSATSMSMDWDPSPTPDVAGYFLYYGLASGDRTNRLDVGNVTSVTVGGVETNFTYYLTLVTYDGAGIESAPSNEIEYAPSGLSAPEMPRLDVQLQSEGNPGRFLRLSFGGTAGLTYQIQATEDLRQWITLWTTNCVSDGLIVFEPANMVSYRFYRLLRQ